MSCPILFIAFNRPDTTRRVFGQIRKSRPDRLYLAFDAARLDKDGEAARVNDVRSIASEVDWPCTVRVLQHEVNQGCRSAVPLAIDWFFKHEEQGIILEDDTLPSDSFFPFCERMLDVYKSTKSVMHIGGHKPGWVGRDRFSISFTRCVHIWGWATWRDRWERYELDGQRYRRELSRLSEYEFYRSRWLSADAAKAITAACSGVLNTWDHQWVMAVRAGGGYAIRPAVNLIENIGIGHEHAVHTRRRGRVDPAREIRIDQLKLPPWVLPCSRLERQAESHLLLRRMMGSARDFISLRLFFRRER